MRDYSVAFTDSNRLPMKTRTIRVNGISTGREAYEAECYLDGVPGIEDVSCDEVTSTIDVTWTDRIDYDRVLDEIEHTGFTPVERKDGTIIGRIRRLIA